MRIKPEQELSPVSQECTCITNSAECLHSKHRTIFWSILTQSRQSTSKYWVLPFSSSWNIKFLGTHWFPASGSLNCCHSVWVNWDMLQTALNFSNREMSAQMTVLPSLCPFSLLPDCWIRGWDFWVRGWDFCNSCKAGAEHPWKSLLFYQV